MPSEPADDPELKAGAAPLSLDGRNHDDDEDDANEKYDDNFCDNHGVHFQSLEEPKDMQLYQRPLQVEHLSVQHQHEESKDSSAFDKLNHLQYDLPRQVEQTEMAVDLIIDESSSAAEQAD